MVRVQLFDLPILMPRRMLSMEAVNGARALKVVVDD